MKMNGESEQIWSWPVISAVIKSRRLIVVAQYLVSLGLFSIALALTIPPIPSVGEPLIVTQRLFFQSVLFPWCLFTLGDLLLVAILRGNQTIWTSLVISMPRSTLFWIYATLLLESVCLQRICP